MPFMAICRTSVHFVRGASYLIIWNVCQSGFSDPLTIDISYAVTTDTVLIVVSIHWT